jgi:hypothetical protein
MSTDFIGGAVENCIVVVVSWYFGHSARSSRGCQRDRASRMVEVSTLTIDERAACADERGFFECVH